MVSLIILSVYLALSTVTRVLSAFVYVLEDNFYINYFRAQAVNKYSMSIHMGLMLKAEIIMRAIKSGAQGYNVNTANYPDLHDARNSSVGGVSIMGLVLSYVLPVALLLTFVGLLTFYMTLADLDTITSLPSMQALTVLMAGTNTRLNQVRSFSAAAKFNLETFYREAKDDGLPTINPHIVVRRLIARGGPYTLADLHSVQRLTNVNLMSQAQFDLLTNIPGEEYSLPLQSFRSEIVGATQYNQVGAVYVFTNLTTGDCRVGSSKCLARRLTDHFSSSLVKGSPVVKEQFKLHGIESFKLTLYKVPKGSSIADIYGLEQYYMILLNPSLSLPKVVYAPGSGAAPNSGFKSFDAPASMLHNIRVAKGKPLYLYNNEDVLLYACLSLSEFQELYPNKGGAKKAYVSHTDKDIYYKGVLKLSTTPFNYVSVPLMSSKELQVFLSTVHGMARHSTPKETLVITITPNSGPRMVVKPSSGAEALNLLSSLGYPIPKKRFYSYITEAKKSGCTITFQDDNTKFSMVVVAACK
jgi:hypothetical protein